MADPAQVEVARLLREELPDVAAGIFFVLTAGVAFAIASMRRRSGVRILVWLGIWTGMFGLNELLHTRVIRELLPDSLQRPANFLSVAFTYLVIVVAGFAFLELMTGRIRSVTKILIGADIVVAILGIGAFVVSGSDDAFLLPNNMLAVIGSGILTIVFLVPALSRRYVVLPQHRVLTVGMLLFALQSLHGNLSIPLNYHSPGIFGSLGFAALLLSLGYTAMEMIVTNERRLFAIDNELEIARQLQRSILPSEVPQLAKLRVAASYLPMTSVAGDFYEFVPVDDHQIGFLVADVSGHGVPAALIASMIKTAMHSVDGCAREPAEVLRRLGTVLSADLRGQFVSAAYLWVNTETRTASYSAAGHPPLLLWRASERKLVRIESNGLLFGVTPELAFPQREVALATGDRVLLYTDGLTETENEAGEAFGDQRLEDVMRENESRPAAALTDRLVEELRNWQPASATQQDDVTLVVVDVL
ncbi:MAG TPA: PP2C family protein-serine/threonine phosphatase [Candidatus Sulfotelmatobacter sp.]|nr:PP2C family protein-serine/threonine phosphatase [Candidatus Sulfotelmatobacter sp.]